MDELIQLQIKLVPELVDLADKRYSILRTIEYNQPLGRRTIANILNKSERWVRSELDILRMQNLIDIQPSGMTITEEGKELVNKLRNYISELKGLKTLEDFIKNELGVMDVIIIPGDSQVNREVIQEIAKAAFEYVKDRVKDHTVIAVSGGYSVLAVAENAYKLPASGLVVVPARGGYRGDLERQANIVTARMANNIGGKYYLLHLPDNISDEVLHKLTMDPDIKRVLDYLKRADIFIFGLSSLESIAKKRNLTSEEIDFLKSLNARVEAYGCYFDLNGNIVHRAGSIGIRPEDLGNINTVIAVGGGASKAEAMILVNKGKNNTVIVTDESAAREIYKKLQGGN